MAEVLQFPGTAPAPVQAPDADPPAEFFSIEARYLIDPAATAHQLQEDANCLLAAGLDILELIGGDDSRAAHYGALYLLRQARASLNAGLLRP